MTMTARRTRRAGAPTHGSARTSRADQEYTDATSGGAHAFGGVLGDGPGVRRLVVAERATGPVAG